MSGQLTIPYPKDHPLFGGHRTETLTFDNPHQMAIAQGAFNAALKKGMAAFRRNTPDGPAEQLPRDHQIQADEVIDMSMPLVGG